MVSGGYKLKHKFPELECDPFLVRSMRSTRVSKPRVQVKLIGWKKKSVSGRLL